MSDAFAHLGGASGKPHVLVDHLRDVAEKAREFAETATTKDSRLADLARCAGWLHDLGKFRPPFQEYLQGRRSRDKTTRHSVFGAAAALARNLPSVSLPILGHHAGLPDWFHWQSELQDPDLSPLTEAPRLLQLLEAVMPAKPAPWEASADTSLQRVSGPLSAPLDYELACRMVFSCLVDADYLDTGRYFEGRERQDIAFDALTLADRLSARIGRFGKAGENSPVDAARVEVHAACLRASALQPGLFSLTAPTGSGKTLAAMAFALEHAKKWKHRRVIVVLPFLAIIEQNARVYREALDPGNEGIVLEHHSAVSRVGVDETEDVTKAKSRAQQATENWDAPVIVTTAVQFLESLFSRRPGRCRKLHNIARSVVIFDEVQTLPFPLLDPILSALRDLSRDYGVTSLLCSATRPTFARSQETLPNGFLPGECREVIADPATTFRTLQRCRLELPFLRETWSWDQLADQIEREPMALVIVNLRKDAQALHDVLKQRGLASLFHLSSTMCPAHREAILGKKGEPEEGTIYRALAVGKCVVVSTQVIEAGVDISFPVVYRATAPLDSIIQAAGRCDREGLLTLAAASPAGRVVVFKAKAPPGYYERATQMTIAILAENANDPSRVLVDPAIFEKFHNLLIAEREGYETAQKIQKERHCLNYKEVDQRFRVIDEAGQGVAVPYGEGIPLIEAIQAKGHMTLDDRRKLQRFTVGLMPNWIEHFRRRGLVEPLLKGQEDGPLLYVAGEYDAEAIGLRLGE